MCFNGPKRNKFTNQPSKGHVAPPFYRCKIGLRLLKISLVSFYLLLMAGDINVNPGPVSLSNYTHPELRDMLSKKGLSILHQNIRGLLANKDNICKILEDFHKIQILSLSETHLLADDEPQVQIDGYSFISKPRKSGKGGGVGAYISSSVPYHRRLDLEQDSIECMWIEVLFPKTKGFLVGFIYRPPDSSKHLCKNFNCKLESMLTNVSLENKECILTGDMNCNYLVNSDHKELKSILIAFGFKQLIKDPTRVTQESRSLIDVIYTNEPCNVYSVKVIPAGLSDHDLIGCVRKIHNFKYQPKLITCRNYAKYDPVAFCNELKNRDFGSVLTSSCVNDAWSHLKSILKQCMDKHAPLITKKIKGRLCPWLSSDVKSEMNLRDNLLRKARKTNREVDWSSYKRQRNKVNAQVKKSKSNYYQDLLQDNASSPDKFWSAIKKLYPTKTPSMQALQQL